MADGRGYTRLVERPRLMLLDAHSLIYRAYFALLETPLSTSKGQLVNAAFGFWSIVLRGIGDLRPDHVICCFDVGRSFRADRFDGYKATRRPTPDDQRANDLAHARVVLEVDNLNDLAGRLQARGRAVSGRVVCKPGDLYARRFMARDPDGHAVMLVQRSQPGETCP